MNKLKQNNIKYKQNELKYKYNKINSKVKKKGLGLANEESRLVCKQIRRKIN